MTTLPSQLEQLETRLLLTVAPEEQLFVYLLNRARHDPVAYQHEAGIASDLSSVPPTPPLAVNDHLFASAEFHATEMATYNYFGHQSQVTGDWPNKMVRDQGYMLPSYFTSNDNYVESLGAGSTSAGAILSGLVYDGGNANGGHRVHLLGIGNFWVDNREIGIGHAYNSSSDYTNYWAVHITRTDPADKFLTGVAYNDLNGNGRYNLNEGLAGVTITAGALSTTTNAGGGWSIPISNGEYQVTASGGAFAGIGSARVTVAGSSVEADFISGQTSGSVNFAPAPPEPPLTLLGTSGNDVITFDPGATTDTVTINGVSSMFSIAGVNMITIDSGTGNDTLNILGNNPGITTTVTSAGTATVNVGRSGSVQGVSGTLSVVNSSARGTTLNIDDSADTTGRTVTFDTTSAAGTITGLAPASIGYDYAGTAAANVKMGTGTNAEIVRAPATGGAPLNVTGAANDVASLVAAGNDIFIGSARYGQLSNTSGYMATVSGGAIVAAYAAAAGSDQANLDLRADPASTLNGAPGKTYLQGSNYATYAFGFGPVYAYGNAANVAKLYPAANDIMVGTDSYGYLAGTGYLVEALGFGNTYAYGGPTNSARFFLGGGDTFVGTPAIGYAYGSALAPGYVDAAVGFGNVTAVGNGNSAYLFPGPHDNFIGQPDYAYINGNGYAQVVLGFSNIQVQGDVTNTAYLFLGSNYQFTSAGANSASMNNFVQMQMVSTSGFGTVNAYAKDNTNTASLTDSSGNDLLYGRGSYVGLFSGNFIVATSGFSSVQAVSEMGGKDHLDLAQLSGQVTPIGNWQ